MDYFWVFQNDCNYCLLNSTELPRLFPLNHLLEVYEGESFQQTCIAQTRPPPHLYWYREGHDLRKDLSVAISSPTPSIALIEILKVARFHEGVYFCRAINDAGEVEQSVRLKVKGICFT